MRSPPESRAAPATAPRTPRVLVIGAGIGGLSAAALLAQAGLAVTLLERAAVPGGKACTRSVAGQALDAGPTVLTMRWVFEQLFEQLGLRLDRQLGLQRADVLARHAWGADQRLDLLADPEASAAAIAAFAGADEAARYRDFCRRSQAVYQALERSFIAASRPNPLSLTARLLRQGLPGLRGLAAIRPFTRLDRALARQFRDPRLRQLFGRYATYCGSSPFAAPATLMLVAHVEQAAVWQLDGGLQRLAQVLSAAAQQHGAQLRCGAEVSEILLHDGRAQGVQLASGERLDADAVLFNGDADALAQGRLGARLAARLGLAPLRAGQRSLSALTWHQVTATHGFPLSHHNVFFSDPQHDGYRREFDAIAAGRLPASPTVYLCAQDRGTGQQTAAPTGPERLMLLVNAPASATPHPEPELQRCEQQTLNQLARAGLRLLPGAQPMVRTTPTDFATAYPGSMGALYGRASQGWRASFQRPGQRTGVPGLYLAGGTVHPGPGVPMASLSGQLAAQQMLADLALRWRFHPVAMPGGMSTP